MTNEFVPDGFDIDPIRLSSFWKLNFGAGLFLKLVKLSGVQV